MSTATAKKINSTNTNGSGVFASGLATGSSPLQNSIQVHTITHSLGSVPKLIELEVINDSTAGGGGHSISNGSASTDGVSTINNQQSVLPYGMANAGTANVVSVASNSKIGIVSGNGAVVYGELTAVTSTTFEITWPATTNVDGTPRYIYIVSA